MRRYDLESVAYGITDHTNIVPSNIIEIGARDAHDAKALATHFHLPDESCYIFEANPAAAESIMLTYPKMHLYNNAVSDKPGKLSFFVEPENIGASSLFQRVDPTPGMKAIEVEAIRMDEFIEAEDIKTLDIVKLDVEGASLDVLKSFGKHIDKLQSIQVESEMVEIWKGGCLFNETAEWLIANNFSMVSFTLLRKMQSDSWWVRNNRLL